MLKHETEESISENAAQARVTPDELNAALKALDADKQQVARLEASTVPIREVVDELHLDATPEQIWAQVQKQRAQKEQTLPVEERSSGVTKKVVTRRVLRGWREIKGWVWVLFWCSGGLGLFTLSPLFHHSTANSSQTITISGASAAEEVYPQGKDVVISGDEDTITLHGKARSVLVSGDDDKIVTDTVQPVDIEGDNDTVKWTYAPNQKNGKGHGHLAPPKLP
ncbi:MAG: DUF3060 domain-containing protein [Janthinobacterium lividum]